jgi:hypothetical protein
MFIIQDWAGNHLFQKEEFETFEDGWSFLLEQFCNRTGAIKYDLE